MSKKLVVRIISLYQKTLSPDHGWLKFLGGTCRYYPTCSEYTKEAIERYGVVKGFSLGFKRVGRCHPFNQGGVDMVPNKK